ncbi:MAG: hypothetical protein ACTHQM_07525 [Thermoanaerobaculia bacterium]
MRYIKGRERITKTLEAGCLRLFGGSQPVLLAALRERYPALRRAFFLDHIPEDDAEFFTIMVAPDEVVLIELARAPRFVRSLEVRNASEWLQTRGSRRKRAAFVAQELLAR